MQRDLIVKTRSLGGTSDLTLLAPIKPGFVESLESVTYKTRIKRVLETLHGARQASHEYATARLLSDSVERVGAIHSVRVAVLEPEDKVLLAVTFDGSRESYIRVLWDKVGTLLDLIFCGTVDYVTAFDHTFDEWMEWANRVQVETGFFYGPPDFTARDVLYHRRVQRMHLRGVDPAESLDLRTVQAVSPSAEAATEALWNQPDKRKEDDPQIQYPRKNTTERLTGERVRNGLQGLVSLYRLVDLHRPGTEDGEVLRHAAIDMLREFVQLWAGGRIDTPIKEARNSRFRRQIDWLFPRNAEDNGNLAHLNPKPRPARLEIPSVGSIANAVLTDIQGGIVRAYPQVTQGTVLLLAFKDQKAAASFMRWSELYVTKGNHAADSSVGKPYCNIALTAAGLRALGMSEDELAIFPEDFRQGMAQRCGLLGDIRNNHPQRWRLPSAAEGASQWGRVELDAVHAVLQLRSAGQPKNAPFKAFTNRLFKANPGIKLLAEQPLVRYLQEHFGYSGEGGGQPELEMPATHNDNLIHLGEVLCGHDTAADFAPDLADASLADVTRARMQWLKNGSFLVVRKYRQCVDQLQEAVAKTAATMQRELGGPPAPGPTYEELIYAKLMGRGRDGVPSIHPDEVKAGGYFDFAKDHGGAQCPLGAHIRLANPRAGDTGGSRPPRIMRRSMSYGPRAESENPDADRGLVFMAYNASISEQFEVIQRWLTAGNATGTSSARNCPFLGVPENGISRHFPFEHQGQVFRVELETDSPILEEPKTITRLEWGLYLFAPSLSVLTRLALMAEKYTETTLANVPWDLSRGRELVAQLMLLEHACDKALAQDAWKTVIEDPDSIDRLDSAAVWSAIRADYGGALKTSYGVLIASRELIEHVLRDTRHEYSISGQFERMKRSFGEIYLGRDAGAQYDQEANEINQLLGQLNDPKVFGRNAFVIAQQAVAAKIDAIRDEAIDQAKERSDTRFEVGFDAREIVDEVLADLCEAWFGIAESPFFQRGGADWLWHEGQPPLYPGHFTALSRYMFQPNPGQTVMELGERYGRALRAAMGSFVSAHREKSTVPDAPIAKTIFNHAIFGKDNDWVARTMVGVMMGFIAPIIGAVLNVLREWGRDDQFGTLRFQLAGRTEAKVADEVLAGPMLAAASMRPMPQIIWRTARKNHVLSLPSGVALLIQKGDKLVLALASGGQQALQARKDGHRLMFGGDRSQTTHPTHACPGYDAGIAAMLGTLSGLLSRAERLRQGGAPLTYVMDGVVEPEIIDIVGFAGSGQLTDFIHPATY